MPEGATILVVDDEPMVLTVVTASLELAGFTVLTAGNGVEALAVCASAARPIDLALLDYFIPEMNGPDLCLRLRERFPAVKVIMMSGYTDQLLDAFQHDPSFAGVSDVLPKPFLPSQLVAKVRIALAQPPESS